MRVDNVYDLSEKCLQDLRKSYYELELADPCIFGLSADREWHFLSKVWVPPRYRGKGKFTRMIREIQSRVDSIVTRPEFYEVVRNKAIAYNSMWLTYAYFKLGFRPHDHRYLIWKKEFAHGESR